MPILSSIGVMSNRGFGLGLTTAAAVAISNAYFAGGVTTTSITTVTKYKYSDATLSTGTALATALNRMGGTSTSTMGYFLGGITSGGTAQTATVKYTFSDDTRAAGTALTITKYWGGSTSTATIGYYGNGGNSTGTTSIQKYTYSGDTTGAGTALASVAARTNVGGYGNSTYGFFTGGVSGSTHYSSCARYTYSGDTQASSGSISTAREGHGTSNSTTIGYSAGGTTNGSFGTTYTTVVRKLTFSSSADAAGTALGTSREQIAGTGDTTMGIFCGGWNNGVTATDIEKYVYSGDTRTATTSLSTATHSQSGVSSTPGGF